MSLLLERKFPVRIYIALFHVVGNSTTYPLLSGTEPVIRIMAQGEDQKLIKTVASEHRNTLKRAAAARAKG